MLFLFWLLVSIPCTSLSPFLLAVTVVALMLDIALKRSFTVFLASSRGELEARWDDDNREWGRFIFT